MEIQDGFIVGVFNYCDRWCERCAFTSHCRLFADHAEIEAALDPNLQPIVDAPPLAEEIEPAPAWMQELIAEANAACREPMSHEEWERIRPRVPLEHQPIAERAKDYTVRTYGWLDASRPAADVRRDPREVISWFHFLIATKINRALTVWPDALDNETAAYDADGSAKVALLGIERSHAAWLELVERGTVSPREADPFITDLVWLGEALERVRPHAREFVRPGFDEPEAVARLLAEQEGG